MLRVRTGTLRWLKVFGVLGLAHAVPSFHYVHGAADEQTTAQHSSIDSRNPLVETGLEKDHLTGNWGGVRKQLVDRGIHFQAGYVGEVLANVAGGSKRGAAYEGLGRMALELDSEKLTGVWRGAKFRASSLWLHGRSPSKQLIGDVLTASNVDAYDSIRLYELWLEQAMFSDRLSIRVGSLLADEEFTGTQYGGMLMNSVFGWPAFISGNVLNTGPAFFVTAPGVRLRLDVTEQFYFQSGLYDGDTFDSREGDPSVNANGVRWHLSSEQGAFFINEIGYKLNQEEKNPDLPGTYKLGCWMHSGDFNDNLRDRTGRPFVISGNAARTHDFTFGAYAVAEQMVWRPNADLPEQGLGVFCRVGGSPGDRSAFSFVFDGGLHYRGLLPGRENDRLALGFAFAEISDDIAHAQRIDHRANRTVYRAYSDFEQVVELTYDFAARPWWRIQPDFQWIRHPGGSAALDEAFVLGLRTSLTF